MKYIVSGSNRAGSRSLKVSQIIQGLYLKHGEEVKIISIQELPLHEIANAPYGAGVSKVVQQSIDDLNGSEGIHMVIPEYNGSYPGALKLFVDHWQYPDTFEQRPVCFVGLGGIFGGLRPVEHMQQVFGYRNGFIFPHRVFIRDVFKVLDGNVIKDPLMQSLLEAQVMGFQQFTKALQSVRLDANSLIADRKMLAQK